MPSTKREIRSVSRRGRATTAKKCTRSVMRVQNYCFANLRVCSSGMTPGSGSEFRDHLARREKRGRQHEKKKVSLLSCLSCLACGHLSVSRVSVDALKKKERDCSWSNSTSNDKSALGKDSPFGTMNRVISGHWSRSSQWNIAFLPFSLPSLLLKLPHKCSGHQNFLR